jgi:dihydrofolate reductase
MVGLISLIAAMNDNRVIGVENRLPWHLPADLKYFKTVTMGKPVLMGRKTYESIGRPLPGRTNIIVTRDKDFSAAGCTVVHSIEEALDTTAEYDEVMVIGGASFYRQMLPLAHRLYITLVHDNRIEGDAHFPDIDPAQWTMVQRDDHDADEHNPLPYSFVVYKRK